MLAQINLLFKAYQPLGASGQTTLIPKTFVTPFFQLQAQLQYSKLEKRLRQRLE